MFKILGNSPASSVYLCSPNSGKIKTCLVKAKGKRPTHSALVELNMVSAFVGGHAGSKFMKRRRASINLLYGLPRKDFLVNNAVTFVESSLVSEGTEKSTSSIGVREESIVPSWGNVTFEQDRVLKLEEDATQLRTTSKELSTVLDNRVWLGETDEEMLSKRLLTLSRSNKVRSALGLYRSMELFGVKPNIHACNSLLSCLLRKQLLDDALKVFESMRKNDVVTAHTYSLILKAIAYHHDCKSALKLFFELEEDCKLKKDFDVVVYNTMISVCCKVNNWVEAERLWRCLKESNHAGSKVTYSLLVSVFVRCSRNDLALDAYYEMTQNGLKPGHDTMQAVIGACTKEGKWDLALCILQDMLESGLKPNQIAFNSVINSLGKAGKVKLAFEIYKLMRSSGHKPDAYTWNALLGALYRASRYADALWLFESIKVQERSTVSFHLYDTALMSCQKLGLWDKALQLLWQMEASGKLVSTESYNLVIGACEVAREPKVALQVYEHMIHQNRPADIFTHLSLIRACIWGSLWNEVEEILDQVSPNASIYNAYIHGMCLRGRVESAKQVYQKMRKYGLEPDGKTRALMLQYLSNDTSPRKR
ncbi:Pentatricopeptide repeat [Dillenia turbinata]|uniref:Pentatricopeptide repeat n=1 Tax=Dillenia turbinata TaxID=194707 RepID=A0AAN8ULD7_9MAGN